MAAQDDDVIEVESPLGFEATQARLADAFEKAGLTVFARIDHAENARKAGLAMPPTVVLIYGNARGGTPVMLAAPHAALDLPLRVLVRETASGTLVAFRPVAPTLLRAGVAEDLAARLDAAQRLPGQAVRS